MNYFLYTGSRLSEYDSIIDLCFSNFKIEITDNGIITVDFNKAGYSIFESTISYNMNSYTKPEALRDFAANILPKHVSRYGYQIIKGENFI
jgi:hypothetical protein